MVEEIQEAEEMEEEEVELLAGLSLVSSVMTNGNAVPVTIGLATAATALLALMTFLLVLLALKVRGKKKQGSYEVCDDRKIIKVSDHEDEDLRGPADCEDDRQQLREIFPHLISIPRSEADILPGPGLVGLGFK